MKELLMVYFGQLFSHHPEVFQEFMVIEKGIPKDLTNQPFTPAL